MSPAFPRTGAGFPGTLAGAIPRWYARAVVRSSRPLVALLGRRLPGAMARRWTARCAVLCAVGCGEPADSAAVCEPTDVTWEAWGAGFFASYCRPCHSADTPERYGAPVELDFDTLEQVRTYEAAIRRSVLEAGSMPVGGGVPEADLVALDEFLACGL